MDSAITKYGTLKGIVLADYYADGSLRECTVDCLNRLKTPYGELIPQYSDSEPRRKYTKSVSFYPDGVLKSISLQEQTPIATSLGVLPAELVTFHENGKIRRLFPLNGKLTGFWSEANEYELAEEFQFKLPLAEFKRKIIAVHFYDNGAVRSMTFWPKDWLTIDSPIGSVPIRIGFSLYPDGSLQSLEPQSPLPVRTPIGTITAYDLNADGMSGDNNSLCFIRTGDIQSLVTSTDGILLTDRHGRQIAYSPGLAPNICDDQKMEPVPLRIEFTANGVKFGKEDGREYKREDFTYTIQSQKLTVKRFCDDCTGY